jgi:hypothetical protein
MDITAAVGIGGSGFSLDDVVSRAHPFSVELPLYILAETRRQHETTNQDDDRKLPGLPVPEGEDDEALSRATTLTQNSVAGAIPPAIM